ncbi:MAG TPA: HipA domain-containing protein [Solirubrobacteraceae bacterium]|jgi:serine/threonine-protein kinase HipA|nr:HipA domain-containing protein [Solirubrobacteraceae bacterium]
MAKPEPLGVWLGGLLVAELTARHPWELHCAYTDEALARWDGLSPVLSCSLPLQSRSMDASVFMDGLLPEGQHRQVLSGELRVAVNDLYALLRRFGRDVAGALVIVAEEPAPRTPEVIPYTRDSLEQEVLELPERPLAIHDDSELSIAGLQDKLLLVRMRNGGWGRPAHGYPSSHILKVDDPLRPGLVEAEAECLRLAATVGLTSVEVEIETIGERLCLFVSRFDRRVAGDGSIERIHQEDLCQALARDPNAARGRGKYEDAGGPSLREAAALLDRYASRPQQQLDRLLAAATFTVLIGNADAHGKNIALLHPTAETVELAPLYDTVPTVLWPRLRARGAMSIGGRWKLDEIVIGDLAREAVSWRVDPARAVQVVTDTAERLHVAATELRSDSAVGRHVVSRAERLLGAAR